MTIRMLQDKKEDKDNKYDPDDDSSKDDKDNKTDKVDEDVYKRQSLLRTNKKIQNHKQVGDIVQQPDGTIKWVLKKTGDCLLYTSRCV